MANRISITNSRPATNMAALSTFQGVGEDVSEHTRIGVSIKSDNATDGTLYMETSLDNVTWSGPPRKWANTLIGAPHMWLIVEKHFRIRYVNGLKEAINLAIQVHYSDDGNIVLGHQLDETLLDETEALVVRSVAAGKNPKGEYVNVKVSSDGLLETSMGNATDITDMLRDIAEGIAVTNAHLEIMTEKQILASDLET